MPEPAPKYAEIVRLNAPDFRPSVESFDLSAALADPANSPKLQPLDTVRVFSRYDFEPPPTVWVGGEVRTPGQYRTSGQVRLRDAIYLAGGVSYRRRAGVRTTVPYPVRWHAEDFQRQSGRSAGRQSHWTTSCSNLAIACWSIATPRRSIRATVYVKGEVAKPGRYPLTTNMHVEDLVQVAGGLKRSADPVKADLTRYALGSADRNRLSRICRLNFRPR